MHVSYDLNSTSYIIYDSEHILFLNMIFAFILRNINTLAMNIYVHKCMSQVLSDFIAYKSCACVASTVYIYIVIESQSCIEVQAGN